MSYSGSHSSSYSSSSKRFHPFAKSIDKLFSNSTEDTFNDSFSFRSKRNDFGIKSGQQGSNLSSIDWSSMNLKKFQKNFYSEIDNHSCTKTDKEILEWRSKNEIQIYTGFNNVLNDANFKWNKKFNQENAFYSNEITTDTTDDSSMNKSTSLSTDTEIPNPVFTFDDIQYPQYIKHSFIREGFSKPTPIQSQSWPIILRGNDLIGIAQTGSGKTLAFLLPAMIHIHAQMIENGNETRNEYRNTRNGYSRNTKRNPIALVVAPTRELAMQIEVECHKFCGSHIKHVCIYGGASRYKQLSKLRMGIHIIVATPGRLLDFIECKQVSLLNVTYLVIDEADRMLDMGFEPQLNCILNQIRPDRQLMLFSATWPTDVRNLAKKYIKYNDEIYKNNINCDNNLLQICIGGNINDLNCNKDVVQEIRFMERMEKIDKLKVLLDEFKEEHSKVLVFISTKKMCNKMQDMLWNDGYYCCCIHGDKVQNQRDRALRMFKNGEMNIMLATDVASRGLHVDDIELVLNFDFPMNIEDYVHRIGRTGRAGKKGRAISFFTRGVDEKRVHDLIKVLKQSEQEIPEELFALRNNARSSGRNGRYGRNGGGRRWGRGGWGGRGRGRGRGRRGRGRY